MEMHGCRSSEALHVLDAQEQQPAEVIAPAPVSFEYPNSDTVVIRIPRPSESASLQASHLPSFCVCMQPYELRVIFLMRSQRK